MLEQEYGKVITIEGAFKINKSAEEEEVKEEKKEKYFIEQELEQEFEEILEELEEEEKVEEVEVKEEKISFDTPKAIYNELKKKVIGQDEAIKKISNDIFLYKKSFKKELRDLKPNILLTGKSGTGKTYMVKQIADLMNLPYEIYDCSVATKSGYVGSSILDGLSNLYNSTRGRAFKNGGIIFLDEFDKLGGQSRDNDTVVTTGVQQELLMALDKVTSQNLSLNIGTKQRENMIKVDCSKILFVLGGSFERGNGSTGIEAVVKNRLKKVDNHRPIGFARDIIDTKSNNVETRDIRMSITKEDIIKFGVMPEVVGRITSLINLKPLEKKDLIEIMKLDDGDLKSYGLLLKEEGVELKISDEFYESIVNSIDCKSTGARLLSSKILEKMQDLLFNLEDIKEKKEVIL